MDCLNFLEIIVGYFLDCYCRCAVSSFLVITCSHKSGARFKLNFHTDSPKSVDLYRRRFILCIHPCTENGNEAVSSLVVVFTTRAFAIKRPLVLRYHDNIDEPNVEGALYQRERVCCRNYVCN